MATGEWHTKLGSRSGFWAKSCKFNRFLDRLAVATVPSNTLSGTHVISTEGGSNLSIEVN